MSVWHEPLGVDFSEALAHGLRARMAGRPPEAMARVTVIVNTARMGRRLEQLLARGGAAFRPRVLLVTDLSPLLPLADLPPADPPLAMRLRLTRLVEAALRADPSLGPVSGAFDLAGSLLDLIEEMGEEGVGAEALDAIDMGDLAKHWKRSLELLRIACRFAAEDARLAAARQAACLDALDAAWAEAPHPHPVIVAGSTASRAPTRRLMEIVRRLPEGHVVLPGLDAAMPDAAWDALDGASEDHPQVRHARLLRGWGMARDAAPSWSGRAPASAARTALVSLALRPPPVTDAWAQEGPGHAGAVAEAMEGVTLLEADTPHEEAEVVALRLRGAVEDGVRAALITPDRTLSRRVAAILENRWSIVADDSAGRPLNLSPPGRLMLQAARMRGRRVEAADLVGLLKHPLAHTAGDDDARRDHLNRARLVERRCLRGGAAHPTRAVLNRWRREADAARAAEGRDPLGHGDDGWDRWLGWLGDLCSTVAEPSEGASLAEHVSRHLDAMVDLAGGSDPDARALRPTGALWDEAAGRQANAVMADLAAAAQADPDLRLSTPAYARLVETLLEGAEPVREHEAAHPQVMIWGALESRVQGAPLVILGGLNEGTWPSLPGADPWLNRAMRAQCGLRSPERTVGLSAHDFQQALGGPEVWLTRARRSADADTVPSRWLNRLTSLLKGMGPEGMAAEAAAHDRAAPWRAAAEALGRPRWTEAAAPRPAPAPPVAARPDTLYVTRIETLIRDPYAIYARDVLGLRPLDPLRAEPDARMRGTVLHDAMARFAQAVPGPLPPDAADRLRAALAEAAASVPWPAARALWAGRIAKVEEDFLAAEAARRVHGTPRLMEEVGTLSLPEAGFTLKARVDRIDVLADGTGAVFDYKTGKPPSRAEIKAFNKQLLLEALMLREGAFRETGPLAPSRAVYLGLGPTYAEEAVEVDDAALAETRARLIDLIGAFRDEAKGYAARRANQRMSFGSDYDRLSRYGEWDETMPPTTIPVGR